MSLESLKCVHLVILVLLLPAASLHTDGIPAVTLVMHEENQIQEKVTLSPENGVDNDVSKPRCIRVNLTEGAVLNSRHNKALLCGMTSPGGLRYTKRSLMS